MKQLVVVCAAVFALSVGPYVRRRFVALLWVIILAFTLAGCGGTEPATKPARPIGPVLVPVSNTEQLWHYTSASDYLSPPVSQNFIIMAASGKLVLTVTSDGIVKVAEGVTPTEAAQEFIRLIQNYLPQLRCAK